MRIAFQLRGLQRLLLVLFDDGISLGVAAIDAMKPISDIERWEMFNVRYK